MADGPIKEEVIVDVKIDKVDTEKEVDNLTKKITALKAENEKLVKVNKELATWGAQNSKEYLENAKQIEINKQKISENTASRKSLITTMTAEDKSIKALRAANKELIKQRDQITTGTAEGRAQIALINKQIEENTEIIRKNVDAAEKQRMNIGNYKSALDGLKPGLGSTIEGHLEMVQGLSKGALAFGAVGVAAGSLFSAYIKGTRGARDFARAQDTLSSATDIVTDSFSEWVAELTGTDKGIGLLERFTLGMLNYLDSGLAIASFIKTQAKDALRELEISERFAQRFYKEEERRAELQRRIRDDESLSIQKRLAAARKVDEYMQVAGQRQIIVWQAQIQAIKESTTNYSLNREAQLKVAELEAEIADKREEITGKLTENAMAVQRLTAEYAELQRTARIAGLDRELEEQHEAFMKQYMGLFGERQWLRDEEEDAIKRFNQRIIKETNDRIKKQTDAEKKAAKEHERIERLKVEATVGGLELITRERSTARIAGNALFQQDAIKETMTNTHAAAVAAYKSLASIPIVGPALGIAAAVAASAYGLARVAMISGIQFADGGKVPGFAGGGLSGTKIQSHHGIPISRPNGDNRLATVKTGEVILNERQQAALGGDETFRRIGVPGFADGGFTGFSETASANRRIDQAIQTRELANLINQIKIVLPMQDFEVAQAAKNSPITKAKVL